MIALDILMSIYQGSIFIYTLRKQFYQKPHSFLQISQKRNVCFVPTERSFRSKRNVYSETNGTRGKERTVTAAGGKGGASPRQGKREESPFPRERVSRRGYRSRMLIPFISNRYDRCLSVNLARQASA